MRVNRYLAEASTLSRRAADQAVHDGRVTINGQLAQVGQQLADGDEVCLDGHPVTPAPHRTIMLNKPTGVVCSRRRQGNTPTVYDILPDELADLNPVGRLDKDTSGLLVLTNDGQLHQRLGHPSFGKLKQYEVELNRPLAAKDLAALQQGVELDDGPSRPKVLAAAGKNLRIELAEGRNRQVRRTFRTLGYTVIRLHRPALGGLSLGSLQPGQWQELSAAELPV